jgi:RNA polymerase sigma factor (sigma-70 family)
MPAPADPAAFDRLVRDWTGYAERWARRREGIYPGEDWWPAAARALWKAAATYDPARGGAFHGWLKSNLRNEAATPLRNWRARWAKRHEVRRACGVSHRTAEPDGSDAERLMEQVRDALDNMPPALAEAVRRSYLGGETHAQIARSQGGSRQRITHQIRRGLAHLRLTLTEADPD